MPGDTKISSPFTEYLVKTLGQSHPNRQPGAPFPLPDFFDRTGQHITFATAFIGPQPVVKELMGVGRNRDKVLIFVVTCMKSQVIELEITRFENRFEQKGAGENRS